MIEQETRRDPDDDGDLIAALAALPRPEAPPALLERIVQSVEQPAVTGAAPPSPRVSRRAAWGAVAASLALGLTLLLARPQTPEPAASPGEQVAVRTLPASGAAQPSPSLPETVSGPRLAVAGPILRRAVAGGTGTGAASRAAPTGTALAPPPPPLVAEVQAVPAVPHSADPEPVAPSPQPALALPVEDDAAPRLVEAPSFGPAPAPHPSPSQKPAMSFRPAGN